jgi:hypothetical protein
MIRGTVALAAIAVALYGSFDVVLSAPAAIRSLSRGRWLLLVALVPFFGAIAWWLSGRPDGAGPLPGGRRTAGPDRSAVPPGVVRPATTDRVRGPEDDPEFIRSLEELLRRQNDR